MYLNFPAKYQHYAKVQYKLKYREGIYRQGGKRGEKEGQQGIRNLQWKPSRRAGENQDESETETERREMEKAQK